MTVQFERAFGGRRVLVTGGAGFVGGAVVRRLVESGAKVTVLDDLFTGRAETIPTQAAFVKGSVTDQALVRELVAQSSLVFHMAARNIIASTANPRDDFETNIGGTLNILLAARESRPDRVVYTSSTSVYGNPRSIPINEDDLLVPITPYAVSKLSGEHYCLAFYESYGLAVATVRYSNVYGPGQRPDNPYCGVVSKFLTNCHQGVPLTVHGDGEQTRDFTYIDDAVDATLLAATHPRAEGDVFNVGTGIETSVNQLAHLTGRAMGRDVEIRHIDRRDIDNIRRRVVNIEKARRMLRWSPQVTMENGLRRTAEWFVAAGFADGVAPDPMVAERGTTVRPSAAVREPMTAAVSAATAATSLVRAGRPPETRAPVAAQAPSTWRPTASPIAKLTP
jgi:UDP-glucose 4-epimerase